MLFKRLRLCLQMGFSMTKIVVQLMYGAWRIALLEEPIVSIFGGARTTEFDFYFQTAHKFAQQLVNNNISVVTGGGGGIMQGASCGAFRSNSVTAKSIGIGVRALHDNPNLCVQEYFELDSFFARKILLTNYSAAFVVFPGGFGTLDEVAGVLTLMQTKQLTQAPIVLIGKEYWAYLIKWINEEAMVHGTLSQVDLNLITVTDDLEEAFCLIQQRCVAIKSSNQ